jgi:hypothetical protein
VLALLLLLLFLSVNENKMRGSVSTEEVDIFLF